MNLATRVANRILSDTESGKIPRVFHWIKPQQAELHTFQRQQPARRACNWQPASGRVGEDSAIIWICWVWVLDSNMDTCKVLQRDQDIHLKLLGFNMQSNSSFCRAGHDARIGLLIEAEISLQLRMASTVLRKSWRLTETAIASTLAQDLHHHRADGAIRCHSCQKATGPLPLSGWVQQTMQCAINFQEVDTFIA